MGMGVGAKWWQAKKKKKKKKIHLRGCYYSWMDPSKTFGLKCSLKACDLFFFFWGGGGGVQGIIFLVSHRTLLCIFYMTAIQNIYCVAVFSHRSVHKFIWNIYPWAEIANQIWRGKLFPGVGDLGIRSPLLSMPLLLFALPPIMFPTFTAKFKVKVLAPKGHCTLDSAWFQPDEVTNCVSEISSCIQLSAYMALKKMCAILFQTLSWLSCLKCVVAFNRDVN